VQLAELAPVNSLAEPARHLAELVDRRQSEGQGLPRTEPNPFQLGQGGERHRFAIKGLQLLVLGDGRIEVGMCFLVLSGLTQDLPQPLVGEGLPARMPILDVHRERAPLEHLRLLERLLTVEKTVVEFARVQSAAVLRMALALVFLWFGALKLFGVSPVADLVEKALPFLPARMAVVATGVLEVTIAVGLLTDFAPRLTMVLFFAMLLGTFSLLMTQPALSFVGASPIRLTVTGEFIVKNVVLLAAGLTLVPGAARRRARRRP